MSEQPDPLSMRASDADRERVAQVLHQAMAEGRLTVSELDERLVGLYQAKTFGELVPFTQDLPDAPTPMPMLPAVAAGAQVAPLAGSASTAWASWASSTDAPTDRAPPAPPYSASQAWP